MKHSLRVSFIAFLLIALVSPCLGMMSIAMVTPQAAKELGINLRFKDSGPDAVWVDLEFAPKGQLKEFQHVSLEIEDGDKLLLGYTPLRETRDASGKVTVRFMAGRNYLDKITLRIVSGRSLSREGHDLRLKEFINPEKTR